MKLQGHVIMIICSMLLQIFHMKRYVLFSISLSQRLGIICFQGLLFLVYPLLGHVADVWLTKYRILKCALVFRWIGAAGLSLCALFGLVGTFVCEINSMYHFIDKSDCVAFPLYTKISLYALGLAAAVVYFLSGGVFEANAIQFGLDQLLEAPTLKLISFIHWYYWSQNVAELSYVLHNCLVAHSAIHDMFVSKKLIILQYASQIVLTVLTNHGNM